jgi:hypothetical protein
MGLRGRATLWSAYTYPSKLELELEPELRFWTLISNKRGQWVLITAQKWDSNVILKPKVISALGE